MKENLQNLALFFGAVGFTFGLATALILQAVDKPIDDWRKSHGIEGTISMEDLRNIVNSRSKIEGYDETPSEEIGTIIIDGR